MAQKRCSDIEGGRVVKKRRAISLEEKYNIVRRHEGGESITSLSRALGFSASTVSTIVKDHRRIKEQVESSVPMKTTVITKKRSGALTEMEKLLIVWIENQRQRGMPLSLLVIKEKAKSLYRDLKAKRGETEGSFAASNGWFSRFKVRANLPNLSIGGEAASVDTMAAEQFPKVLADLIEEDEYLKEQIFTVTETYLFWKRMPDCTYIANEEEEDYKPAKDRLTLLFGANAEGDCKLKPLLVYNRENPRALKHVDKWSLPVVWMSNPKAWITVTIFEEYFRHHLITQLQDYCQVKGIPFKILLILNIVPSLSLQLDDLHPDIRVVFLPPNTTSLLQPMEQGVIQTFKAYYLRRTFVQAIQAIDRDGTTLKNFWMAYNIYDSIKNIAGAWDEISPATMNGVWKNLCPQLVSGSQGLEDTVGEEANKVADLARRLDLDCDAEDVENLLESHGEELTNEELIEMEVQLDEEEDNEDVDEAMTRKNFTTKEMAEAFKDIARGMTAFEKMDPDATRFARVNKAIQDGLSCYKAIYAEKKSSPSRLIKKGDGSPEPSASSSAN